MVESHEKMERQLSVRELERLIFLTFMHSQGSPELQELLHEWIALVYGLQNEEKVRSGFEEFVSHQFIEEDSKINLSQKNMHVPVTRRSQGDQISFMTCLYTQPKEVWDNNELLGTIFRMMAEKDREYLKRDGRPNRLDDTSQNNLSNKYFSFVKTYLNDLQTTGDAALDQLYKKLHDWVIDRPEHDEIVLLLQEQERKLSNV